MLADPPEDLARYYGNEYHAMPTPAGLQRAAERESYQIAMLTRHVAGGRMVEIGSGPGVFASQARRAGFDVTAIEMDEDCCRHLESVVGVAAIPTNRPEDALGDLPPSHAIALWQSLEHLPEPWVCLEAAAANLEQGGILLVATPNPDALGLRLMGARWPHLDAPRHLHLVPPRVLTDWLAKRGMYPVALSLDDLGARRWNRFAWQRLMMNAVSGRSLEMAAFAAGALASAVLSPIELRGDRASSYTAVFRKAVPA